MIKCDLHVHSKYSDKPTNWITKKFGAPESHTEPLKIYRVAKDKGMTHVTITDHNKITGAQEIASLYDDAFVSCEVTALFPEDNCKCHVLVYDITEIHYKALMYLRKDIYEMVGYIRENDIWHALAHPFYAVSAQLNQWHFEKFLLLFDLFELNGSRSHEVNNNLVYIVNSLTTDILERLYDKHKVGGLTDPTEKHFVRGSDDHSGLFVARNYTKNHGKTISDFFENAKYNYIEGMNSTPKDLAYSIYTIGYQHLDKKLGLEKYVSKDLSVAVIDKFMTMREDTSGPISRVIKQIRGLNLYDFNDIQSVLLKSFRIHKDQANNLNDTNISDKWFDLVGTAANESTKDLLDYLVPQLENGNFFNIFRSMGSISALYFLLLPFYISYFVFENTRKLSKSIKLSDDLDMTMKKCSVGHFTDTFREVNGVAITLRQVSDCAKKHNIDYTFITCTDKEPVNGEMIFEPVKIYDLPEYPELKVPCPPILDIVDYCYEKGFSHIHVATPGPMGLVGMLVAKLLQKPLYTTYHTDIPGCVEDFTGESFMTSLSWQYVLWFCSQCDKVFVRSQDFFDQLLDRGLDPKKLIMMSRGVDTEKFRLPEKRAINKKNMLLYTGRVSTEKGLKHIVTAFKGLDKERYGLTVVGDGPYLEEMRSELSGYDVEFTGYLSGQSLIEEYQKADLFVFPSTFDTMGNVILEASACGTPSIVTDKGGPKENVVNKKTGFIIGGNNPELLKNAIEEAFSSHDLHEMGLKARKLVEGMSFDKFFLDWISYYD